MNKFFLLTSIIVLLASCNNKTEIDRTTVAELDLDRYIGKWYEIARFDHSFERNLVGCTANYSFKEDGTIRVINSGYKKTLDGKYDEAEGKARRPDASKPGQLEVAFFANFYADYNVLELDEAYTYALIGSKKDKFLWILSRTPQMNATDLDYLMKKIEARGYNANELIWVEHAKE